MQDSGARVGYCPCRSLPRGTSVPNFLYFDCANINKKILITEHGKGLLSRDSPMLLAIRPRRPGCPFRAIRPRRPGCPFPTVCPPGMKSFRLPWWRSIWIFGTHVDQSDLKWEHINLYGAVVRDLSAIPTVDTSTAHPNQVEWTGQQLNFECNGQIKQKSLCWHWQFHKFTMN